jgi:SSS family solute:Na+ symporter
MATLGWISGCAVIWSALFAIGNFLYFRYLNAGVLTVAFLISGSVLLYVTNHLWDAKAAPVRADRETELAVH